MADFATANVNANTTAMTMDNNTCIVELAKISSFSGNPMVIETASAVTEILAVTGKSFADAAMMKQQQSGKAAMRQLSIEQDKAAANRSIAATHNLELSLYAEEMKAWRAIVNNKAAKPIRPADPVYL